MFGLALGAAVAACGTPPAETPCRQYVSYAFEVRDETVRLDVLVAIDDSPRMGQTALRLGTQLDALMSTLVDPPCVSADNHTPHLCTGEAGEVRQYPPIEDLHVAVVSSDLGSGGVTLVGCSTPTGPMRGDDGLLGPLVHGPALLAIPPDPAFIGDCLGATVPTFLAFESSQDAASDVRRTFRCSGALGAGGCIAQQPLEAMYRAIVERRADSRPDNTGPNAGFLRDAAYLSLLAIGVSDDFSVRDCAHSEPGQPCDDATSVFDLASTRWAGMTLPVRMDRHPTGSLDDPTWPLDRYVDPANPMRGFPSLKPGHPERVTFGAITGVPIVVPQTGTGYSARPDWDALLGSPGAAGPDDFAHRDGSTALSIVTAEGPISMRPSNLDPDCFDRVVPACRREGTTYEPSHPACAIEQQDFARPARRLVEVARRFSDAALCNGAPCGTGAISSVCSNDWTWVMRTVVARTSNGWGRCLPFVIDRAVDASGFGTVPCRVLEYQPVGAACDPIRGRTAPTDPSIPRSVTFAGETRAVCELAQVPTDANDRPRAGGVGWFYSLRSTGVSCRTNVRFTRGDEPANGAIDRLECTVARDACGAADAGWE